MTVPPTLWELSEPPEGRAGELHGSAASWEVARWLYQLARRRALAEASLANRDRSRVADR